MEKIINLIDKAPIKSFGNSMKPLLYENDFVYFEKVKAKQIKINDILLIKKGSFFIHRTIYKNDRYLITKGDNNLLSDAKIRSNQVLGRVTKIKRGKNFYKPKDIYLIQSSFYLKEIIKIKKLLEKNRIKYVFLKGIPLHFFFEDTHPKRLYADCDVLVDKKDFEKARKILSRFGYKNVNNDLSPIQRKLKDKETESSFLKIINGVPVVFDIHLEPAFMMTQIGSLNALYPQKLIDQLTTDMLQNKQEIKVNNGKFLILNSKFLIIYLSLHFFHHNFRGAFRLDFLDKVIRKSRLSTSDWQNIASTINNYQLGNFVYPVFILLQKYYNTPLSHFSTTMKQSNNEIIKRYLRTNIFNDETRLEAGINRFKNLFFLSPRPLIIKLLVFLNPQVIYSIFFVLKEKLSYFLRVVLKNR